MKKIILVLVFIFGCAADAMAKGNVCRNVLVIEGDGTRLGCTSSRGGATYKDLKTEVQTLGATKVYCDGKVSDLRGSGFNARYKCVDYTGVNNPWDKINPVFDTSSPLQANNVSNATYAIVGTNGKYKIGKEAKLTGVCDNGYYLNNDRNKCDPVSATTMKCEASTRRHGGACVFSQKCLQTPKGNGFLYCYSHNYYRRNVVVDYSNSCIQNVHGVGFENELGTYYKCNQDGVWKLITLSKCENSDFDSLCKKPDGNRIENCVIRYKNNGNYATSDTWGVIRMDGDGLKCWEAACKDGYSKVGNKCVLDSVLQNQKTECEKSHGTWDGYTCSCSRDKGLILSGGKCVCSSDKLEYSKADEKCVLTAAAQKEQNLQNVCKESHGEWQDGKCICDSGKGLENYEGVCICKENNREYDEGTEQCELTAEAQKLLDEAKESCKDSFGDWAGDKCDCKASKNLVVDDITGLCICTDSNYERDDEHKICVKKASVIEQEKCKADSNAEWTEDDRCVCKLTKHQWDGEKCADTAEYTSCVNASASGTQWEEQKGCTCTDKTKVWSAEKQLCIDTPVQYIKGNFEKLKNLTQDLDVSKWKSSDGKFNVARLASDSIAGVVLGTASGLITSTVVKKSQAKKGLENIQCEIGGTVVADYGDEFRVGKQ